MTKRNRKVINKTLYRFSNNLDGRINAIMNCVNTETKLILLAFCFDENPKGYKVLRSELQKCASNSWTPYSDTVKTHCKSTFLPFGMIIEELFQFPNHPYPIKLYRISPEDEKYGKPIAAFLQEIQPTQKQTFPAVYKTLAVLSYLLSHYLF